MSRQKAVQFLQALGKYRELDQKMTIAKRDLHYRFKAVRSLVTANEYRVLLGRIIEEKTLNEIGEALGNISRQRVAQIEARGIERLQGIVNRSPQKLPEVPLE